jgi:hypothetical protein
MGLAQTEEAIANIDSTRWRKSETSIGDRDRIPKKYDRNMTANDGFWRIVSRF